MNKIIAIATADIVLDYRGTSDVLNDACTRGGLLKVAGLCDFEDKIILSLEESDTEYEYVFAQFPSMNEDDVIGEIRSRYFAGFSTVGDFDFNNNKWGLFARGKKKENDLPV